MDVGDIGADTVPPPAPLTGASTGAVRGVRQPPAQPPSGHVFKAARKRGDVWYAKYRLPDGRQVQRKIGPAWSGRGRPAAGYFTKRLAEDWLRDVLDAARRGTLPGMVLTGARFEDAAAEYMRYVEQDKQLKPSTLRGYRYIVDSRLLPAFSGRRLEDITTAEIERWLRGLCNVRLQREAERKGARHGTPLPLWNATVRYLHYAPREEDARLVAEAFRVQGRGRPSRSRPGAAQAAKRRPAR